MTHMRHTSVRTWQRQRGFSLIEIMISLTIGLVVLIAIGFAYMNSSNINKQQESQVALSDPARIVMRQLRSSINSAGYVDVFDIQAGTNFQASALFSPGVDGLANMYQRIPTGAAIDTPLTKMFAGLLPVFGCDGAMNSTPNAIANAGPPAVLSCGTASATRHTIQLAFQGVPDGGAIANPMRSLLPDNAATGDGRDCLQQATNGKFVINRFFVQQNDSDGVNELICSGSGGAVQQPIARGVEEFMLRYLVSSAGVAPVAGAVAPAAGNATAQYLNAAGVALDPVGWPGVTAVEICFVSASPQTSGAAGGSILSIQSSRPTCARDNTGAFSADVARAAGDLRLWRRYTAVVAVRNAAFSSPY